MPQTGVAEQCADVDKRYARSETAQAQCASGSAAGSDVMRSDGESGGERGKAGVTVKAAEQRLHRRRASGAVPPPLAICGIGQGQGRS